MTTRKEMQTTLDRFHITMNEVMIKRKFRSYHRLIRLAQRIHSLAETPTWLLVKSDHIMIQVEKIPNRVAMVRERLHLN